jgi:kynurenine formamidase
MGLHAGTHVDVPLHFLPGGRDVTQLPPELFFGPAVAIDSPKGPGEDITPRDLAGCDIREGDIVLFRTGWEARMHTQAFFREEWPGFTAEAVRSLVARKVKAIGGDIASADSPAGIARGAPAHKAALEAGLPIFEALVNLDRVVGRRFTFIGLPLLISGAEASPVRALALLER